MRPLCVALLLPVLAACERPSHPVDLTTSPVARAWTADALARRADAGDLEAATQLVFLRVWSDSTATWTDVAPELTTLADRGSRGAARMLAWAYTGTDRRRIRRDHAEAARWLARAAELGDAEAARDLAAYRASTASDARSPG